jgi:dihydroxy-acid dehydratase
MEAGKVKWHGEYRMVDLIDAMIEAADDKNSDADVNAMERSACPTCGSCSGMFTANSMNCLTEALGLALPGNGSLLATHADREKLFVKAGRLIVDLCRRYYEKRRLGPAAHDRQLQGLRKRHRARHRHGRLDQHRAAPARRGAGGRRRISPWPTSTACRAACPACQGGAGDAEVPHGGRASRRRHHGHPRRARPRRPASTASCPTVLYPTLGEALDCCDVKRNADPRRCTSSSAPRPGGVPTQTAFSQSRRYPKLDLDRANGCIRDKAHAYSQDGGLAVLFGNIAEKGCIVKTAGVDDSILKFTGRARVCESQEEAVEKILADQIVAGDVVVVRYEGPKGGPGMQEMLYPTSYIKSKGLGKECALLTDGRFSGGTSGLSIGHASPEAAAGGAIGLVEEGDTIEIDIPNRRIHLAVEKSVLAARRAAMEAKGEQAWKPAKRERTVSAALQAYAAMTTSADTGAVRDVKQLGGR